MKPALYFDAHVHTKPFPEVLEKLMTFYGDFWMSSVAPPNGGKQLYSQIDEMSHQISELLKVPSNVYCWPLSSSFEACRQVFSHHYLSNVRQTGKNHILTTNIEQAPILLSLNQMEELGCVVKTIRLTKDGTVDLEDLKNSIGPKTSLLSLSWVDPLTGIIQPVDQIGQICQEQGLSLHIDASFAVGKIHFHLDTLLADYVTVDASRFHGPLGAAAVFSKFKGDTHLLNVPMLAAFTESLRLTQERVDSLSIETARLRNRLEAEVKGVPLFQKENRIFNTSVIAFPHIHNEALLFLLHEAGVYATIGGGELQQLTKVLTHYGIDQELASSAISFALPPDMTDEMLDQAIQIIGGIK